jgi:hypothetical protein
MTVPPMASRSSTELNLARHMGQLFARSTQGFRHALCRSCPQGRRWATISSSSSILDRGYRSAWCSSQGYTDWRPPGTRWHVQNRGRTSPSKLIRRMSSSRPRVEVAALRECEPLQASSMCGFKSHHVRKSTGYAGDIIRRWWRYLLVVRVVLRNRLLASSCCLSPSSPA